MNGNSKMNLQVHLPLLWFHCTRYSNESTGQQLHPSIHWYAVGLSPFYSFSKFLYIYFLRESTKIPLTEHWLNWKSNMSQAFFLLFLKIGSISCLKKRKNAYLFSCLALWENTVEGGNLYHLQDRVSHCWMIYRTWTHLQKTMSQNVIWWPSTSHFSSQAFFNISKSNL